MTETLFISDLHLSPQQPATVKLFLDFLRQRAPRAEQLYILGDLFDAWIGDDNRLPAVVPIITALKAVTETATEIFFMHGNRDFLIGDGFLSATGCRLLDDPWVIDLYGTPTLLTHGDLLCTDDIAYQQFRAHIRDPQTIEAFLAQPIAQRLAIAADYRKRSGEAVSQKADDIMDVNQDAVAQQFKEHRVSRIIHGHTHRPADHRFELDGGQVERLVLADWHRDRCEVLCVSAAGIRRETLSFR